DGFGGVWLFDGVGGERYARAARGDHATCDEPAYCGKVMHRIEMLDSVDDDENIRCLADRHHGCEGMLREGEEGVGILCKNGRIPVAVAARAEMRAKPR